MASAQTKDGAKLQDTRQLLDELDALMDQMLALPITDQNENDVAAAETPGTVTATLTMLDPQGSPDDAAESHETPTKRSAPEPISVLQVATPAKVEHVEAPAPVVRTPWRPDHISYQFLLWLNQGYDDGTHWLGKPGKLLRSRAGKTILGVAGLALLGVAAAWLGLGW